MVLFFNLIFLGPIGLFYATVVGALVMLVITVIIGFVTFGFGLFIPYVICVIWAIIAVNSYNNGNNKAFSG
jgi:ABC-type transport system involved in cytochrome bd biosynthesis fused ATPase/permease subunit